MNKRELILKLQDKSCYSCKWHKEYTLWMSRSATEEQLLKPVPKILHQAIWESIEEKRKSLVYKCCLDYGQFDFPAKEICINYDE